MLSDASVAAPHAPAYSQTPPINNLMIYTQKTSTSFSCTKVEFLVATSGRQNTCVSCTLYTRGELFTLAPALPFGLRTPNLHIRYFPRANYRGMIGHYFCTNPCIVPANPLGFDWPPFIPSL